MSATVREYVTERTRAAARQRLDRLVSLNAPKIMIERANKDVEKGIPVAHLDDFGDAVIVSTEPIRYRRGYGTKFETDRGTLWLIPGPHGLFLTDKSK